MKVLAEQGVIVANAAGANAIAVAEPRTRICVSGNNVPWRGLSLVPFIGDSEGYLVRGRIAIQWKDGESTGDEN